MLINDKRSFFIFVLLFSTLIFAGLYLLRDNVIYYLTPKDLLIPDKVNMHKEFRLGGFVVEGSLVQNGDNISFKVSDNEHTITMNYRGILPGIFKEGSGVIASGVIVGSDKMIFNATSLLAKHNEVYHPPELNLK